MGTREQRLRKLEQVNPTIFPLLVRLEGTRFRIEAPQGLAGRLVSQAWIGASGADPVIIDNVPESEGAEKGH